ncbi:hypothetical protein [Nocardia sp. MW-W600-9]
MLARATFGAMTFGVLITVATTAGDEFASWVVFDAARGDLDTAVGRIADPRITGNLGSGILLVLSVLGLISLLVQLVMLVVRQALLVVVVAVIPMAAAASGTGPGSQAYKRLVAWSLAFVLWKPVGALVYAIAFTVTGSGDEPDPQMILLGVILMVMSVIVLPALIRLIAPAASTLGGGGGAASALVALARVSPCRLSAAADRRPERCLRLKTLVHRPDHRAGQAHRLLGRVALVGRGRWQRVRDRRLAGQARRRVAAGLCQQVRLGVVRVLAGLLPRVPVVRAMRPLPVRWARALRGRRC